MISDKLDGSSQILTIKNWKNYKEICIIKWAF